MSDLPKPCFMRSSSAGATGSNLCFSKQVAHISTYVDQEPSTCKSNILVKLTTSETGAVAAMQPSCLLCETTGNVSLNENWPIQISLL